MLGKKIPLLERKGGLKMKKRAVVFAVTLGLSVFAFGSGQAVANESGNAAVDCAGFGAPGQGFQTLGAAGPDQALTPPELAAALGQESVGAAGRTFCTTPADSNP
jgi:hypothetical protein